MRLRYARRPGANVFECLFGCSGMLGAAAGSVLGFKAGGVLGAVAGLPIGAVLGVLCYAVPVLTLLGVFALGVWVREGRGEARRFLWGERGARLPADMRKSNDGNVPESGA